MLERTLDWILVPTLSLQAGRLQVCYSKPVIAIYNTKRLDWNNFLKIVSFLKSYNSVTLKYIHFLSPVLHEDTLMKQI